MSDEGPLPDWFVREVEEALRSLGWTLKGWEGRAALVRDDKDKESRLGMDNLLRRAQGMEEDGRVERLATHLRSTNSVTPPASLSGARERLLVRLREPFHDDAIEGSVWSCPLPGTGLVQVLVIDFPEAMNYVTRDMIEGSGRTGEQWLAFALDNLRAVTNPEMVVTLEDECGVFGCGTGDAYDAARALVMDRLWPDGAPHGFLLSVPTRDVLLFYPVDEELLDRRFPELLVATTKWHQNEPYPISDKLFWVQGGRWQEVAWDCDDGQLSATLPGGLRELFDDE